MKNSIFNLAVALVVITSFRYGSFQTRKGKKISQQEVVKA